MWGYHIGSSNCISNKEGDYMFKTLRCLAILALFSTGLANAAIYLNVDNNLTDKIKIEPYYYTMPKPGATNIPAGKQNFIVTLQDNTINIINIRLNPTNWSGSPIRVSLTSFPMQDGKYNVIATYTSSESGNKITMAVNAYDQSGTQYKSVFTKKLSH